MTTGIVTAGGHHSWETGVVAELSRAGAPLSVVRRCADMADVLAIASTGQVAAALVSADLRRLDGEMVCELAAFGVLVVAVYHAGDARTPDLLDHIGIADTVADDATPAAMVHAVQEALARGDGRRRSDRGPGHVADSRTVVGSDPARALGAAPPDPVRRDPDPASFVPHAIPSGASGGAKPSGAEPQDGPQSERHRRRAGRRFHGAREVRPAHAARVGRRSRTRVAEQDVSAPDVTPRAGRVVAVWGPAGAPGRSTVAMGLADRMVAGGSSVVLIDADVYGGVLASAFGLLDESAGLAGACRLASHGRLGPADFAGLCWQVRDRFTLMTGIARADRWPELRPSAIPVVLDAARAFADCVVVDCASVIESDEEITFDTLAPRRNGATLAVLDAADVVIAVGAADPAGMERLARGYADVVSAVAGLEPKIVFNRVRSTAASPSELREASRRFCGCDPVAFLPEDRALVDMAWRRGVTLSMVASKSSLISAFDGLAEVLSDAPSGR